MGGAIAQKWLAKNKVKIKCFFQGGNLNKILHLAIVPLEHIP